MRLFIDLDTRTFVESPQFPRALQSISLKRRDRLTVDAQFLRDNVVVELHADATGKLGLKADKDFNGPFVASDAAWVKSGSGAHSVYRFDLNLNTLQVDALFAGIPTPPTVLVMLEIEWVEDDNRTSSNTLSVNLENDVVRGDEGIPTDADPPYPPPEQLVLNSELFRVGESGAIELWNPTLDAWVRLSSSGNPPTLELTPLPLP